MQETEIEMTRTNQKSDNTRIREIETWFRYEYIDRLNRIERYKYLGLPLVETRWELEIEAYDKENELRQLKGLSALPEIKFRDLL
jgi:hypothetical protein